LPGQEILQRIAKNEGKSTGKPGEAVRKLKFIKKN
jgi:hypothetical protein